MKRIVLSIVFLILLTTAVSRNYSFPSINNKLNTQREHINPFIILENGTDNETLPVCFLKIRSTNPEIYRVSINGTEYNLSYIGTFVQNTTIEIGLSSDVYAYDDYGFSASGSAFNYTVPLAENATLTLVKLDNWHPGSFGAEKSIEFRYGTVPYFNEYYYEAYYIQYSNGLLFIKTGKSQQDAVEIIDTSQNPMREVVVYTSNWGDISAVVSTPVIIPNPTGFYVNNNLLLYVRQGTSSGSSFEIYNISNITDPQLVGYLNLTDWEHMGVHVITHENYAIVTSSTGVFIVDISNISNPVIVEDLTNVGVGLECHKSVLHNNTLYLAYEYGFYVFNATNLTELNLITDIHLNRTVFDIFATDKYLFVATGLSGLYIYSVENISNIHLVKHVILRETKAVEYFGGYLFVADGFDGFKILNVSDINNITVVEHIQTDDNAQDIEVVNDIVYVSCRLAGILAFNISNISDVFLTNSFNYSDYYETSEYTYMSMLGIEFYDGGIYCSIDFKAGDYKGKILNVKTMFLPLPVFIYEDLNGDGVFTQIPTRSSANIYKYEGYDVPDKRILMTTFTPGMILEDYEPEVLEINGTYWGHLSFSMKNVSLVTTDINWGSGGGLPIYDTDISSGAGKVNVTYHFYFLWNNTDVYVKLKMEIDIYNLTGDFDKTNFSVYSGFLISAGYTSMGSTRSIPFNLTQSILGKQMFSMLGTRIGMVDMSGNYSIIRNDSIVTNEVANISIIYPWGFFNYSLESIIIGANFHNVQENDTIIFDPYFKAFRPPEDYRALAYETAAPEIVEVYWTPEQPKVNDSINIYVKLQDRSPITNVTIDYTFSSVHERASMILVGPSLYSIEISGIQEETTLSFRIISVDYWRNILVSEIYNIPITSYGEEQPGEQPEGAFGIPIEAIMIALPIIAILPVIYLIKRRKAK
ncbi:MAG: LVIVD repeat-containing protein [Candidatus Njordarchaeum guaymaensis]